MRYISCILTLCLAVVLGCGDDEPSGTADFQYSILPPATALAVGQDSTVPVGVTVRREGTDTNITGVQLTYTSADVSIARVNAVTGLITGIKGGTTQITVTGQNSSIDVPVTVRGWPATSVVLSVLSAPFSPGVVIGTRLNTDLDTGTFYGLPGDSRSSRLKAIITRASPGRLDTVYCNYCVAPVAPALPRVQRLVIFRSLNDSLATVSNANDPTLQTSVDTAGRVTVRDTSSTGVKIVIDVPGDGLSDTVTLKLKLRPLDTLRIRPDSTNVPTANGTGLQRRIWPGYSAADTLLANINDTTVTNFSVLTQFVVRVQDLPVAGSNTNPALRFITINPLGGVTTGRRNLPAITWESALPSYLSIDPSGQIIGPCAAIGAAECPSPTRVTSVPSTPSGTLQARRDSATNVARDSLVIKCVDNGRRLPGTKDAVPPAVIGLPLGPGIQFGGIGTLNLTSCPQVGNVFGPNIPMPGAFCTGADRVSTPVVVTNINKQSTCTIWIRATAIDPATGKILRQLYRINVFR